LVTTDSPVSVSTMEVLWFGSPDSYATAEYAYEFVRTRMPPSEEGNYMRFDRHFLRKAKAFLIELTALLCLLLVLIKIIVTEAHQLFH